MKIGQYQTVEAKAMAIFGPGWLKAFYNDTYLADSHGRACVCARATETDFVLCA